MIVWFCFIIINTISDLKTKKISLCSCFVCGALRLILCVINGDGWIETFIIGSMPGLFVAAASAISRGSIGAGDGVVMLVTGWYLGAIAALQCLLWALLSSAMFGILLLLFRKVHRKTELPFVPFLLFGGCLQLLF